MLDHLKRLGTAAVVAGTLGVGAVAAAAPAQAQEPALPAPAAGPPLTKCEPVPPLTDEWTTHRDFVRSVEGQACAECLDRATALQNAVTDVFEGVNLGAFGDVGVDVYCWELNPFEARLYYRTSVPPSAEPAPVLDPVGCIPADPEGDGWWLDEIYFNWQAGQACDTCLSVGQTVVDFARSLPEGFWSTLSFCCKESGPTVAILYFRL
jgi:hypothetical protein